MLYVGRVLGASDPHGDHGDVCIKLAGLRSWRHNQVRDEGVLAPCKQVGLPAYREEPDLVDGTADPSTRTASRRQRASPLNVASMM